LELVPFPKWLNSRAEQTRHDDEARENDRDGNEDKTQHAFQVEEEKKEERTTLIFDEDPRKLPMVADIVEELKRTDNILVTEIGKRGLLEYLKEGWMGSSGGNEDEDDLQLAMLCDCHLNFDWELKDDASFWYLMEILQANMIYFLKRRYFDLERYRSDSHGNHSYNRFHESDGRTHSNSSRSIAEDFRTIFDKASTTRYLANRERIASRCFRRFYQQKNKAKAKGYHAQGLAPPTIRKALVRLHRRAGIYLPFSGIRGHPSSCHNQPLQDGVDNYWIDMWWICSSLLGWILEPCLKITFAGACECHGTSMRRSDWLYRQQHSSRPPKKARLQSMEGNENEKENNEDDRVGFIKQSHRVLKIPLGLIRTEVQRLGLYYDNVLLHDGPWDDEIDENYVCKYNNSYSNRALKEDSDEDDDGAFLDERDDDCADEYEIDGDVHGDGGEKDDSNPLNVSGETKCLGDKDAKSDSITNDRNQGEGNAKKGKGRNLQDSMNDIDDNCEKMEDDKAMAVYNSFWLDNGEIIGV
jgi:hypothetical protein